MKTIDMEKEKRKSAGRKNTLFFGLVGLVLLLSGLFFFGKNEVQTANAPAIITYQGKILNNSLAVTTTLAMKFVLYDSLTEGTALYTASGTLPTTSTINVTPSNGLFSVDLGGSGTNTLDETIFKNNSAVYLEVMVGGQKLSPRKRLTAAPYAFNAKYLDGVGATSTPQGSAYIPISDSSGNFNFSNVTSTGLYVSGSSTLATTTVGGYLGVGISNPIEKMHIGGGNILHTASGNPTLKGSLGAIVGRDVYVSGKYAYVAGGDLYVVDISNPALPVTTSVYVTPGHSYGVHVSGKYAYVADYDYGLQIINISNPSSPTLVGSYDTGGESYSVYVSGKYAYLADGPYGFKIIDISNPATPTLVGSINPGGATNAKNVYISGKYAYVAEGEAGLRVVDISNPTAPTSTGLFAGGVNCLGVHISGKYAYVADGYSVLQIIDISNPASPTSTGVYNTTGFATDVYVSGKYAYVADGTSGLLVVDISSSTNPIFVGNYDTPGNAIKVYISGKYAYVADLASGLQIIDINGIDTPSMYVGNIQTNGLTITENVDIWDNLSVRGGLNVGENGLMINGDFGMSGVTTNTLSFSTTTLFKTAVTSTALNAFIFDTATIFSPVSTTYLLSVRNGGTAKFSVAANGDVNASGNLYAASATVGTPGAPGDLAERVDIAVDDTVEAGDVLVVDPSAPDTYRRSSSSKEQAVAGVVSTNPTIAIGNGKTDYTAVMAMVGRVPVKVTNEGGAIVRGDLLVSASLPGYAKKYDATKDDSKMVGIIGVALDPFDETTGKIMALIRTGWAFNRAQTISTMQQDLHTLASAQGVNINTNPTVLNVENNNGQIGYTGGNLDLQGNMLLNVAAIVGKNNRWTIDSFGRFVSRLSTSQGEKEMYALQSPVSEFVFSSSSQLIAGEARIVFDLATQEIINPSEPLKVNVTLTSGGGKGIYISEKNATGFVVKELDNGNSNATFDWIVVATRRGDDSTNPTQPDNNQIEPVITVQPNESAPIVENLENSTTTNNNSEPSGTEPVVDGGNLPTTESNPVVVTTPEIVPEAAGVSDNSQLSSGDSSGIVEQVTEPPAAVTEVIPEANNTPLETPIDTAPAL